MLLTGWQRFVRVTFVLAQASRSGTWRSRITKNDASVDPAAALAASCRLRGADAFFVALAEALDEPLITLDREIPERSSRVIEVEAPDVWVNCQ